MTPHVALIALPVGTFALTWYAARPHGAGVGPARLAAARAAVIVGGFAVGSVELLSAVRRLHLAGVLSVWAAALLAAGAAAAARGIRVRKPKSTGAGSPRERAWAALRSLGPLERWTAVMLAVLVLAEFTLAIASPPNNYDSQSYHLPRVERWVQQGGVQLFPVFIHRQITYPPGAEYLLLHLRLLTGTDRVYQLVQWSAGLLCLLLAARIAAQLGAARRAQLLTALVVGTVPLVVLESSSTQTDLVVAAWVGCVATLALDGVGRHPAPRRGPGTVLLLGLGTGLVAVTKATGLLAVGPLLVWWALAGLRPALTGSAAARAAAVGRVAAATVVVATLTVALVGPQLWRVHTVFGHPLGPGYLRDSLTMQRHDPASIVVNGLRQAHTLYDLPAPPVNRWTAARVEDVARALGVDPDDPAITFDRTQFPEEAWYPHEDKAALPLHAVLLALGVLVVLRRRADRRQAAYAAVLVLATLLYIATFKWQPWGNRLVLFLVVLAGPLAGAFLDRVLDSKRRAVAAAALAALAVATLAGFLSAAYGFPRRLVGAQSVFALSEWDARFLVRPQWADDYAAVGAAVNGSGARRIGVLQRNDSWEYPWWLLFRGKDLRPLQSQLPYVLRPTPNTEVDAIVCTSPEQVCRTYAPPGWTVRYAGEICYVLPPGR